MADEAPHSRFTCPVCSSSLRLTRGAPVSVGTCPVCQSRVVAPQPQFGCRAMAYRDWLKLQEIDPLDLPTPPPPALPKPATRPRRSTASPSPRPHPPHPPRPSRRVWGISAVGIIILVSTLWWWWPRSPSKHAGPRKPSVPQNLSIHTPPGTPKVSPPAPGLRTGMATTEITPSTPASPPTASPIPPPSSRPSELAEDEGTTALPRHSPLASVLARSADSPPTVVALAARRHDFSRSAPQPDTALCLKLTDPADESITTRAYIATTDPLAGPVQELLPWGHHSLVRVGLQWQPPDPDAKTDGYWRITSFELNPGPQSMASASPRSSETGEAGRNDLR